MIPDMVQGGSTMFVQDGVTSVQSSSSLETMSAEPKVTPPFMPNGRPPAVQR